MCDEAEDGQEAANLVKKSISTLSSYDVILVSAADGFRNAHIGKTLLVQFIGCLVAIADLTCRRLAILPTMNIEPARMGLMPPPKKSGKTWVV